MEDKHILFAYVLDGNGGGTPLTDDTGSVGQQAVTWVHLQATHPDTRGWLGSAAVNLDPLIVDALLADETRPRMLAHDDGTLIILRGVNFNANADPEDMVSIRIWVEARRVISVRRRPIRAIMAIEERLRHGNGPTGSSDIISMMVSGLTERMAPTFAAIETALDDIESVVMEQPDASERQTIITLRKQAIIFRRYIAPQRDVIAQLRNSEQRWLTTLDKRRLQESLDRTMRYLEDLDALRERAQIIKDELATALADKLNKNLYILSVIAAVFLPLGFFTGLLGVNVGGIPGAYNPFAFTIFIGMLSTITVAQIVIFKKMKWF